MNLTIEWGTEAANERADSMNVVLASTCFRRSCVAGISLTSTGKDSFATIAQIANYPAPNLATLHVDLGSNERPYLAWFVSCPALLELSISQGKITIPSMLVYLIYHGYASTIFIQTATSSS
jgi:hypothetical protein